MPQRPREGSNFVAEWFGHRIYPVVAATELSVSDQKARRCPFLSEVTSVSTPCIKNQQSRGVCTVSAKSNGFRQDWVVCPFRVFDPALIDSVAARLFAVTDTSLLRTHAAPTVAEPAVQTSILNHLESGGRSLVYFRAGIGGEVSLARTQNSPEMAFDVTFVELLRDGAGIKLGQFAILELQTMDFHGSYRHAVSQLQKAVDLFPDSFPAQLELHPEWAGKGVEGPNIANVVKRTFWQMFFKFSFAADTEGRCAGTALAIPRAVWDSWQPFLGSPTPVQQVDGTFRLLSPESGATDTKTRAWVYVFDIDSTVPTTPNPVVIDMVIGATASSFVYHALTEAPRHAADALFADTGIYAVLRKRLRTYWPEQVRRQ